MVLNWIFVQKNIPNIIRLHRYAEISYTLWALCVTTPLFCVIMFLDNCDVYVVAVVIVRRRSWRHVRRRRRCDVTTVDDVISGDVIDLCVRGRRAEVYGAGQPDSVAVQRHDRRLCTRRPDTGERVGARGKGRRRGSRASQPVADWSQFDDSLYGRQCCRLGVILWQRQRHFCRPRSAVHLRDACLSVVYISA